MAKKNTQGSSKLDSILAGAQLPALPQSAIRLLELSKDPKNGPHEFAVPIEADPGLTGQVLRFVNSSYFGFSREISSVKLAITMVGIRTIKNFSLWSAVFSLMPNPRCGPFDLKSLWQDSLRRGLFARATGKMLGMTEAEDLFAAALLQDMAVPLLAKEMPECYAELLQARASGQARLSDLERVRFGWTHADAAARMTRQWNLPDDFTRLIERHIAIDELIESPATQLSETAVALSALLPTSSDEGWCECQKFEECFNRIRPAGGASIAGLLEQTDREFAEFAPVLKINASGRSLVESYQRVTVGVE
jgi:HD-like signal output (HDOD) protein